jgi:hypothetical protein
MDRGEGGRYRLAATTTGRSHVSTLDDDEILTTGQGSTSVPEGDLGDEGDADADDTDAGDADADDADGGPVDGDGGPLDSGA